MYQTSWKQYLTPNGTKHRIRVKFGWKKIEDNKQSYWSVVAETQYIYHGKWHDKSYGTLNNLISKSFQELEKSLKWCGCFEDTGPIHYEKNAKYWWNMIKNNVERRIGNPDPLESFKRVVIFGAIPDEQLPTDSQLTTWLYTRLPKLVKIMHKDCNESIELMKEKVILIK